MRIKVDEDLPRSVTMVLRNAGYETDSVRDEHLCGCPDENLWGIVQHEKRFLVTADKGFGDVRRYPPGTHSGVLLLRPESEGTDAYVDLLHHVLQASTLENLTGMVSVASSRGLRIRRESWEA
ncbi:MAG TPA: DUF5615 family PIN-like protein [Candidatus Hydrogenedentes bacterium]|nr:DUF5615 family PIN-like protein [Candidatus Hydrogenedentota bacterium]HOS01445.1 DUF5615 family PIN-like protein [Candidatus Hydrogenedentota bacterium]